MTNPQTEARAIALKVAGGIVNNSEASYVVRRVTKLVATALAAKDAELAEVKAKANYWRAEYLNACRDAASFSNDLLRAESSLAERETVTDEMVDMATTELLAHGEFSSIRANNVINARIAASAALSAALNTRTGGTHG